MRGSIGERTLRLGTVLVDNFPLRDKLTIFVLVTTALWLWFCVTFVLGEYQTTNGDYGQYYMHAQNILNGRSWDFWLEKYPSVLPGWPAVLGVFSIVFGASVFSIGILNCLLWCSISVISWLHFRSFFDSSWAGLLFFIVCLTSPYVMVFQQEGQPNLFYSFSFVLAMFVARNVHFETHRVMFGCCLLLPAFIRVDSVVIYIGLATYFLSNRMHRVLWVPILGFFLTIALDVLISLLTEMNSNFEGFYQLYKSGSKSETQGGVLLFVENYFHYLIGFVLSIPNALKSISETNTGHIIIGSEGMLSTKVELFNVALLVISSIGFFSVRKVLAPVSDHKSLFSLERMLLIGHVGFVGLFLLAIIPVRYVLPILPLFVFFVVKGLELFIISFKLPHRLTFIVIAFFAFQQTYPILKKDYSRPETTNYLYHAKTDAVADYIQLIHGGRPVGFWKARLLMVILNERGLLAERPMEIRIPRQAVQLFEKDGIYVHYNNYARKELMSYLKGREDVCITWRSDWYTVYQLMSSDRVCLEAKE